jgi:hypothetical protein
VKAKATEVLHRAEAPRQTPDYSYERQVELLEQAVTEVRRLVSKKRRTRPG